MRPSGFDFLPDGHRAAVCTWDGDVWSVADSTAGRRAYVATNRLGLFQPLGLKIVAGQIYVGCRDQIVCLHDSNGDGETDFYESFNSDHQVTEHFHEFAMDLQTDSRGQFLLRQGSRHGLPAVVPHHGTLLKVSKDGGDHRHSCHRLSRSNGVCINSDGTFFLSDQEGTGHPKTESTGSSEGASTAICGDITMSLTRPIARWTARLLDHQRDGSLTRPSCYG